jgi:hypothetical protein
MKLRIKARDLIGLLRIEPRDFDAAEVFHMHGPFINFEWRALSDLCFCHFNIHHNRRAEIYGKGDGIQERLGPEYVS